MRLIHIQLNTGISNKLKHFKAANFQRQIRGRPFNSWGGWGGGDFWSASCPLLGFILACSRNSFPQVNRLRKLHSARYYTRKWRNDRHWCESLGRRPLCPQTRSKHDRDDQLHPARRCHSLQDLRMGLLRAWARSCARTELWCLPRTRVDLPPQERSPGGTCVHYLHLGTFSKRFVEARWGFERSE